MKKVIIAVLCCILCAGVIGIAVYGFGKGNKPVPLKESNISSDSRLEEESGIASDSSTSGEEQSSKEDAEEKFELEKLKFELDSLGNAWMITGYEGESEVIVIPSVYEDKPVTGIADGAFADMPSLSKVELPESITSIGKEAFRNCEALKDISLPEGVTEINGQAFKGCKELSHISLPDSLTVIGEAAFEDCKKLLDISIPEEINEIKTKTFKGCSALKNVVINGNLENICEGAFADCPELSEIVAAVIPEKIDGKAFDVEMPVVIKGNHEYENIERKEPTCIEEGYVKKRCIHCGDEITEILPAKGHMSDEGVVTKAPTCTEKGLRIYTCTVCGEVIKSEDIPVLGHDLGELIPEKPATCEEEGVKGHYHCDRCGKDFNKDKQLLENLVIPALGHNYGDLIAEIPATCEEEGVKEHYHCDRCGKDFDKDKQLLEDLVIPALGHDWGETEYIFTEDGKSCTAERVCKRDATHKETADAIISNEVTKRATYIENGEAVCTAAFTEDWAVTQIKTIEIPKLILSEGLAYNKYENYAEVSGLGTCKDKTIVIASEYDGLPVTSISRGAFEGCYELKSIVIPDSVTSIGNWAFERCSGLKSVVIDNGVTSIDSSAFKDCRGLEEVHISDIAAWCNIKFDGRDSNPLSYAGELYLNDNLITDLVIPDGVTSIGDFVFYNCSGLTSVTIPNSVTSIGDYAFYDCSGLTSIVIPDSVTSIGRDAFAFCCGLKEVHISDIAAWCNIKFDCGYSNPLCYAHNLYLNDNLITDLVIPDSVTSIGSVVFWGCSGLQSIVIPDSVTSIEHNVFLGCYNINIEVGPGNPNYFVQDNILYKHGNENKIEIVYIPKNVVNVTIPDGVTSIDQSAFEDCSRLMSVTIGNSVTSIGDYAFKGCSELQSIVIPDGVTSIGYKAFDGCSGLTNVTIGSSVSSIDGGAFEGCYRLVEVCNKSKLDITVGSWDYYDCVGGYAKNIYTPDSGTSKLSTDENGYIIYTDGNDRILVEYTGNETDLILPSGITEINKNAFTDCSGLQSIVIPDSVTSIGGGAFYNCSGLKEVHITDLAAWCNIMFDDWASNPLYYAHNIYLNDKLITDLVIPNSVTSIGWDAFRDCSGLKSIVIPDSVTSIGGGAFYNCSGLQSIDIGSGVTSISGSAFGGCSGLKSVVIPDSVTSIGDHAFLCCGGLTSLTIGSGVTSISGEAFYKCYRLVEIYNKSELDITAGRMWDNGCVGCYAKNIYSPESGASKLSTDENGYIIYTDGNDRILVGYTGNETDLILPSVITGINKNAFYDCSGLTSVTIPDSVTSIGDCVFYNCSGLQSIVIPDSVTSIGNGAFYNCSNLQYNLYNNAKYLGNSQNPYVVLISVIDKNITTYDISNDTKIIYCKAFYGCSKLTNIVISNNMTSIGYSAFRDCSRLQRIVIPDSKMNIGSYAFDGCYGLKEVYYKGNKMNWSYINIHYTYNDALKKATRYYYRETKPTEEGNFWHYDESGNIVKWA